MAVQQIVRHQELVNSTQVIREMKLAVTIPEILKFRFLFKGFHVKAISFNGFFPKSALYYCNKVSQCSVPNA